MWSVGLTLATCLLWHAASPGAVPQERAGKRTPRVRPLALPRPGDGGLPSTPRSLSTGPSDVVVTDEDLPEPDDSEEV
eukprot:13888770-Alexandrium_andersonii.AAC.1